MNRIEDAGELLTALVRLPSVTPRGHDPSVDAPGERLVAEFVAAWLGEHGVAATLQDALPGRPNVVATVAGRSNRLLLLETHLDTVETVGMADPYCATMTGGRLYGRGACDAKGSLAAFMLVLARLQGADSPPPVTVVLAAVADEEHSYQGVLTFLERHVPTEHAYLGAIVGEPTGLAPGVAHTGCLRYTIHIDGQSGHSSRPDAAVNAIALAAVIVDHIETVSDSDIVHPLLGRSTRTVTRISGGEGPNIVPGHCEIDVDRRTLPGEDPREVLERTRGELSLVLPGRVRIDEPFMLDFALDTNANAEIVRALSSTLGSVGRQERLMGLSFGTDASKIARRGIPAVVFGPGAIKDAHTVGESVELDEVTLAADVILQTIASLEQREVGP
jgi:acetylornithine deacetylase/succinyl-diaminopimelate desuccinylase-like protein